MSSRSSAPETPALFLVRPNPDLPPTAYVRGVPGAGRLMSLEEAQPLLDAGLVVIEPAAPAEAKESE